MKTCRPGDAPRAECRGTRIVNGGGRSIPAAFSGAVALLLWAATADGGKASAAVTPVRVCVSSAPELHFFFRAHDESALGSLARQARASIYGSGLVSYLAQNDERRHLGLPGEGDGCDVYLGFARDEGVGGSGHEADVPRSWRARTVTVHGASAHIGAHADMADACTAREQQATLRWPAELPASAKPAVSKGDASKPKRPAIKPRRCISRRGEPLSGVWHCPARPPSIDPNRPPIPVPVGPAGHGAPLSSADAIAVPAAERRCVFAVAEPAAPVAPRAAVGADARAGLATHRARQLAAAISHGGALGCTPPPSAEGERGSPPAAGLPRWLPGCVRDPASPVGAGAPGGTGMCQIAEAGFTVIDVSEPRAGAPDDGGAPRDYSVEVAMWAAAEAASLVVLITGELSQSSSRPSVEGADEQPSSAGAEPRGCGDAWRVASRVARGLNASRPLPVLRVPTAAAARAAMSELLGDKPKARSRAHETRGWFNAQLAAVAERAEPLFRWVMDAPSCTVATPSPAPNATQQPMAPAAAAAGAPIALAGGHSARGHSRAVTDSPVGGSEAPAVVLVESSSSCGDALQWNAGALAARRGLLTRAIKGGPNLTPKLHATVIGVGQGTTGTRALQTGMCSANVRSLHWGSTCGALGHKLNHASKVMAELWKTLIQCVHCAEETPATHEFDHSTWMNTTRLRRGRRDARDCTALSSEGACVASAWYERTLDTLKAAIKEALASEDQTDLVLSDSPFPQFVPELLRLAPGALFLHTLRARVPWAQRRARLHSNEIICREEPRAHAGSHTAGMDAAQSSLFIGECVRRLPPGAHLSDAVGVATRHVHGTALEPVLGHAELAAHFAEYNTAVQALMARAAAEHGGVRYWQLCPFDETSQISPNMWRTDRRLAPPIPRGDSSADHAQVLSVYDGGCSYEQTVAEMSGRMAGLPLARDSTGTQPIPDRSQVLKQARAPKTKRAAGAKKPKKRMPKEGS